MRNSIIAYSLHCAFCAAWCLVLVWMKRMVQISSWYLIYRWRRLIERRRAVDSSLAT